MQASIVAAMACVGNFPLNATERMRLAQIARAAVSNVNNALYFAATVCRPVDWPRDLAATTAR